MNYELMQKTLASSVVVEGAGLHTGEVVHLRICPAPEDFGIMFVRMDLAGEPAIKAISQNVVSTNYATTLGSGSATVATVEHLLGALYGLGVDNAVIEIRGPEVPILDGSASVFVKLINKAGLVTQNALRRYIVVKKPIGIVERERFITIMPSHDASLSVEYAMDFPVYFKEQAYNATLTSELFENELVMARTYGFLNEVEFLRANGLAKGGSLDNAVVISADGVINEGGLRSPDEPVRHKVLDCIGDLALAGYPIIGALKAKRTGHSFNHRFVQHLLRRPDCWEYSDLLSIAEPSSLSGIAERAATL